MHYMSYACAVQSLADDALAEVEKEMGRTSLLKNARSVTEWSPLDIKRPPSQLATRWSDSLRHLGQNWRVHHLNRTTGQFNAWWFGREPGSMRPRENKNSLHRMRFRDWNLLFSQNDTSGGCRPSRLLGTSQWLKQNFMLTITNGCQMESMLTRKTETSETFWTNF